MESWRKRLKQAIETDGRSYRAISRAAQLGDNYVSELLGVEAKEPGVEKLLRLCGELGVSATYILTGSDVSPESEEFLSLLARLPSAEQATLLNLARQLAAARR